MMKTLLYCLNPKNPINKKLFDECGALDWVLPATKPPEETFLIIEEGRLGLADPLWPKILPVYADFQSNAINHRRLHGGGAGQAVAKAIGLNKRRNLQVWDATAGLGRDSFVMATLGANVTMFERNPLVLMLLRNGLDHLSFTGDEELMSIYQRLTLVEGCISTDTALPAPDVIYLDPMFPERSKSAKVKKDMALFHEVVGPDSDSNVFLNIAMDIAQYRVVVKRSKNAPVLGDKKPSTALVGKSSRFDIYTKKAIV